MKKILVIHTRYQNIGGEDIAVENEVRFLNKYYQVETLYFQNEIQNFVKDIVPFFTNQNKQSQRQLEIVLDKFKPDFAYVHNTWFKASIGIFKTLQDKNVPFVLKLHNFRYNCTKSYSLQKHLEGEIRCNACGLEKNKTRSFNKYFMNSYLKSILVNKYGKTYIKFLSSGTFPILVLTEFHKRFISKKNIRSTNIEIVPNSIENIKEFKILNTEKYFVYAGRISAEKGVEELIVNFKKCNFKNITLKIIGTGPLLNKLKMKYQDKDISFLGEVLNSEVLQIISNSNGVVTATKLYEGQPTLLCEASRLGIPSIFPRTGGIEEFFPENYGLSFKQFDYKDLKEKLILLGTSTDSSNIGRTNSEYIQNYLNEKSLLEKFERVFNDN